jgi:hypothetical protein
MCSAHHVDSTVKQETNSLQFDPKDVMHSSETFKITPDNTSHSRKYCPEICTLTLVTFRNLLKCEWFFFLVLVVTWETTRFSCYVHILKIICPASFFFSAFWRYCMLVHCCQLLSTVLCWLVPICHKVFQPNRVLTRMRENSFNYFFVKWDYVHGRWKYVNCCWLLNLKLALTVVVCIWLHACIFTVTMIPEVFPLIFLLLRSGAFLPHDMKCCHFLNDVWNVLFIHETWRIHSKVQRTQMHVYCHISFQEKNPCLHPVFVYMNNNDPFHPLSMLYLTQVFTWEAGTEIP